MITPNQASGFVDLNHQQAVPREVRIPAAPQVTLKPGWFQSQGIRAHLEIVDLAKMEVLLVPLSDRELLNFQAVIDELKP